MVIPRDVKQNLRKLHRFLQDGLPCVPRQGGDFRMRFVQGGDLAKVVRSPENEHGQIALVDAGSVDDAVPVGTAGPVIDDGGRPEAQRVRGKTGGLQARRKRLQRPATRLWP